MASLSLSYVIHLWSKFDKWILISTKKNKFECNDIERERCCFIFFFRESRLIYLRNNIERERRSSGNFCLIIRDLYIYICNETCAHVHGRICKVSSACKRWWDQREKSRMYETAQGKCEIIRFFSFFLGWEKEIKLTISFCIHTYRVYVNIWYSVSLILPFDNDHIGTIIFRIE